MDSCRPLLRVDKGHIPENLEADSERIQTKPRRVNISWWPPSIGAFAEFQNLILACSIIP